MISAVVEIDAVRHVGDLQPHFISRVQVESRLQRKLTPLISGRVCHPTPTVEITVQIKSDAQSKFVRRRERKLSQSRKREETSARSRCRKCPRFEIHRPTDVHLGYFEWNWSIRCVECRVLLNVEIRRR